MLESLLSGDCGGAQVASRGAHKEPDLDSSDDEAESDDEADAADPASRAAFLDGVVAQVERVWGAREDTVSPGSWFGQWSPAPAVVKPLDTLHWTAEVSNATVSGYLSSVLDACGRFSFATIRGEHPSAVGFGFPRPLDTTVLEPLQVTIHLSRPAVVGLEVRAFLLQSRGQRLGAAQWVGVTRVAPTPDQSPDQIVVRLKNTQAGRKLVEHSSRTADSEGWASVLLLHVGAGDRNLAPCIFAPQGPGGAARKSKELAAFEVRPWKLSLWGVDLDVMDRGLHRRPSQALGSAAAVARAQRGMDAAPDPTGGMLPPSPGVYQRAPARVALQLVADWLAEQAAGTSQLVSAEAALLEAGSGGPREAAGAAAAAAAAGGAVAATDVAGSGSNMTPLSAEARGKALGLLARLATMSGSVCLVLRLVQALLRCHDPSGPLDPVDRRPSPPASGSGPSRPAAEGAQPLPASALPHASLRALQDACKLAAFAAGASSAGFDLPSEYDSPLHAAQSILRVLAAAARPEGEGGAAGSVLEKGMTEAPFAFELCAETLDAAIDIASEGLQACNDPRGVSSEELVRMEDVAVSAVFLLEGSMLCTVASGVDPAVAAVPIRGTGASPLGLLPSRARVVAIAAAMGDVRRAAELTKDDASALSLIASLRRPTRAIMALSGIMFRAWGVGTPGSELAEDTVVLAARQLVGPVDMAVDVPPVLADAAARALKSNATSLIRIAPSAIAAAAFAFLRAASSSEQTAEVVKSNADAANTVAALVDAVATAADSDGTGVFLDMPSATAAAGAFAVTPERFELRAQLQVAVRSLPAMSGLWNTDEAVLGGSGGAGELFGDESGAGQGGAAAGRPDGDGETFAPSAASAARGVVARIRASVRDLGAVAGSDSAKDKQGYPSKEEILAAMPPPAEASGWDYIEHQDEAEGTGIADARELLTGIVATFCIRVAKRAVTDAVAVGADGLQDAAVSRASLVAAIDAFRIVAPISAGAFAAGLKRVRRLVATGASASADEGVGLMARLRSTGCGGAVSSLVVAMCRLWRVPLVAEGCLPRLLVVLRDASALRDELLQAVPTAGRGKLAAACKWVDKLVRLGAWAASRMAAVLISGPLLGRQERDLLPWLRAAPFAKGMAPLGGTSSALEDEAATPLRAGTSMGSCRRAVGDGVLSPAETLADSLDRAGGPFRDPGDSGAVPPLLRRFQTWNPLSNPLEARSPEGEGAAMVVPPPEFGDFSDEAAVGGAASDPEAGAASGVGGNRAAVAAMAGTAEQDSESAKRARSRAVLAEDPAQRPTGALLARRCLGDATAAEWLADWRSSGLLPSPEDGSLSGMALAAAVGGVRDSAHVGGAAAADGDDTAAALAAAMGASVPGAGHATASSAAAGESIMPPSECLKLSAGPAGDWFRSVLGLTKRDRRTRWRNKATDRLVFAAFLRHGGPWVQADARSVASGLVSKKSSGKSCCCPATFALAKLLDNIQVTMHQLSKDVRPDAVAALKARARLLVQLQPAIASADPTSADQVSEASAALKAAFLASSRLASPPPRGAAWADASRPDDASSPSATPAPPSWQASVRRALAALTDPASRSIAGVLRGEASGRPGSGAAEHLTTIVGMTIEEYLLTGASAPPDTLKALFRVRAVRATQRAGGMAAMDALCRIVLAPSHPTADAQLAAEGLPPRVGVPRTISAGAAMRDAVSLLLPAFSGTFCYSWSGLGARNPDPSSAMEDNDADAAADEVLEEDELPWPATAGGADPIDSALAGAASPTAAASGAGGPVQLAQAPALETPRAGPGGARLQHRRGRTGKSRTPQRSGRPRGSGGAGAASAAGGTSSFHSRGTSDDDTDSASLAATEDGLAEDWWATGVSAAARCASSACLAEVAPGGRMQGETHPLAMLSGAPLHSQMVARGAMAALLHTLADMVSVALVSAPAVSPPAGRAGDAASAAASQGAREPRDTVEVDAITWDLSASGAPAGMAVSPAAQCWQASPESREALARQRRRWLVSPAARTLLRQIASASLAAWCFEGRPEDACLPLATGLWQSLERLASVQARLQDARAMEAHWAASVARMYEGGDTGASKYEVGGSLWPLWRIRGMLLDGSLPKRRAVLLLAQSASSLLGSTAAAKSWLEARGLLRPLSDVADALGPSQLVALFSHLWSGRGFSPSRGTQELTVRRTVALGSASGRRRGAAGAVEAVDDEEEWSSDPNDGDGKVDVVPDGPAKAASGSALSGTATRRAATPRAVAGFAGRLGDIAETTRLAQQAASVLDMLMLRGLCQAVGPGAHEGTAAKRTIGAADTGADGRNDGTDTSKAFPVDVVADGVGVARGADLAALRAPRPFALLQSAAAFRATRGFAPVVVARIAAAATLSWDLEAATSASFSVAGAGGAGSPRCDPMEMEGRAAALLRVAATAAKSPAGACILGNKRMVCLLARWVAPPPRGSAWDLGRDVSGHSPRCRRAALLALGYVCGTMPPQRVDAATSSVLGTSRTPASAVDAFSPCAGASYASPLKLPAGSQFAARLLEKAGAALCADVAPERSSDPSGSNMSGHSGIMTSPCDIGLGRAQQEDSSCLLACLAELSFASSSWRLAVWRAVAASFSRIAPALRAVADSEDVESHALDSSGERVLSGREASRALAAHGVHAVDVHRAAAAFALVSGARETLRPGARVRVKEDSGIDADGFGVIVGMGRSLYGHFVTTEAISGLAQEEEAAEMPELADPAPVAGVDLEAVGLFGPGPGKATVVMFSEAAVGEDPAALMGGSLQAEGGVIDVGRVVLVPSDIIVVPTSALELMDRPLEAPASRLKSAQLKAKEGELRLGGNILAAFDVAEQLSGSMPPSLQKMSSMPAQTALDKDMIGDPDYDELEAEATSPFDDVGITQPNPFAQPGAASAAGATPGNKELEAAASAGEADAGAGAAEHEEEDSDSDADGAASAWTGSMGGWTGFDGTSTSGWDVPAAAPPPREAPATAAPPRREASATTAPPLAARIVRAIAPALRLPKCDLLVNPDGFGDSGALQALAWFAQLQSLAMRAVPSLLEHRNVGPALVACVVAESQGEPDPFTGAILKPLVSVALRPAQVGAESTTAAMHSRRRTLHRWLLELSQPNGGSLFCPSGLNITGLIRSPNPAVSAPGRAIQAASARAAREGGRLAVAIAVASMLGKRVDEVVSRSEMSEARAEAAASAAAMGMAVPAKAEGSTVFQGSGSSGVTTQSRFNTQATAMASVTGVDKRLCAAALELMNGGEAEAFEWLSGGRAAPYQQRAILGALRGLDVPTTGKFVKSDDDLDATSGGRADDKAFIEMTAASAKVLAAQVIADVDAAQDSDRVVPTSSDDEAEATLSAGAASVRSVVRQPSGVRSSTRALSSRGLGAGRAASLARQDALQGISTVSRTVASGWDAARATSAAAPAAAGFWKGGAIGLDGKAGVFAPEMPQLGVVVQGGLSRVRGADLLCVDVGYWESGSGARIIVRSQTRVRSSTARSAGGSSSHIAEGRLETPFTTPAVVAGTPLLTRDAAVVAMTMVDAGICAMESRRALAVVLRAYQAALPEGSASRLPLSTEETLRLFQLINESSSTTSSAKLGSKGGGAAGKSVGAGSAGISAGSTDDDRATLSELAETLTIALRTQLLGSSAETRAGAAAASSGAAAGGAAAAAGGLTGLLAGLGTSLIAGVSSISPAGGAALAAAAGGKASAGSSGGFSRAGLAHGLVAEVARNIGGLEGQAATAEAERDDAAAVVLQSLHAFPANAAWASEASFPEAMALLLHFDKECSIPPEASVKVCMPQGAMALPLRDLKGKAADGGSVFDPVLVHGDTVRIDSMFFPSAESVASEGLDKRYWGWRVRVTPIRRPVSTSSGSGGFTGQSSFEFGAFLWSFVTKACPEIVASGALHSSSVVGALLSHIAQPKRKFKGRAVNMLAQLLATPELLAKGGKGPAKQLLQTGKLLFNSVKGEMLRLGEQAEQPAGLLQTLQLAVLARRAGGICNSDSVHSQTLPPPSASVRAGRHGMATLAVWPPADLDQQLSWLMGMATAMRHRWPLPERLMASVFQAASGKPPFGGSVPTVHRNRVCQAQLAMTSWRVSEDQELARFLIRAAAKRDVQQLDLTSTHITAVMRDTGLMAEFPKLRRQASAKVCGMLGFGVVLRSMLVIQLNTLLAKAIPYVELDAITSDHEDDDTEGEGAEAEEVRADAAVEAAAAAGAEDEVRIRALAALGRSGRDWTLGSHIRALSHLCLPACKKPILDQALRASVAPDSSRHPGKIWIHQGEAMQSKDAGQTDPARSKCVLAQLAGLIHDWADASFKVGLDRGRLFQVGFQNFDARGRTVNEAGIDVGGLFRDTITTAVDNAFDTASLSLFMPAPAPSEAHGGVGLFMPNPAATSRAAMQQYEALGIIMGVAIRTEKPEDFKLSSYSWKRLLGRKPRLVDLSVVDSSFSRTLNRLLEQIKEADGGQDDPIPELIGRVPLSVRRSDGLPVALPQPRAGQVPSALAAAVPGFVAATKRALLEHARNALEARLTEHERAFEAMRRGIARVVPPSALRLLTWREFETLIAGENEIEIDRLRRHTRYINPFSPSHPAIRIFWQAVETFTQAEREMLIQFAWGRSRLPAAGAWNESDRFVLSPIGETAMRQRGGAALPLAHTCFFQIELPVYESVAQCRDKFLTALHGSVGALLLA
ncbi:hypothetical protein FNF29_03717 [Cafeteria roenbergensis]|uniref:HECT domain-containing protein n=1 Tax=Cafeteria roenbergensis TaxID=33653 RepID=A0A5A8CL73_CAFRO|nr:hypothetical protein FNF29_03717 [Cafeteria roenbergensis]|eukprot:KAA0152830.1 hypothetical protein FNF29_03717 [Cafeteria roenbergensis]